MYQKELLTWHNKLGHVGFHQLKWMARMARGRWCADCYTVWRTMHGNEVILSFWKDELQKPDVYAKFMCECVAFISLKIEGQAQIRKSHVDERISLFQRLFSLMGGTFGMFQVCAPLCDVEEGLVPNLTIDSVKPEMLLNMMVGGNRCLGVAVPSQSLLPTLTVMQRPLGPEGESFLPPFTRLRTESTTDQRVLKDRFEAAAIEEKKPTEKIALVPAAPAPRARSRTRWTP